VGYIPILKGGDLDMVEAAHSFLGTDLTAEAAAWRARAARWLDGSAQLVHVSGQSTDVRVYRAGNRVLKLRRLTPPAVRGRSRTLLDEYNLLERLADAGVAAHWCFPRAVRYRQEPGWEGLEMTAVEAPASFDPVLFPFRENLGALCRLARRVLCLNLAGLSHGDLTAANAGFDASGRAVLLDLDQAVTAHPVRCVLRDFLGVPCVNQPAQYTLWDRAARVRGLGWLQWPGRLRDRWRRRRAGFVEPDPDLVRRAEIVGDPVVKTLAGCWLAAARSGASSPGSGVAYYSLDVRGFHLPGERPWPLRWEMLGATVSFQDKRVVELGCNLGLLAIHARLAGAASVIAADHNAAILAAGRDLARLCGVEVGFTEVNFDDASTWEERLGEGDLVTALSVTYWLKDRERLWRYLGRFAEVVFEGHEPREEIEARFGALGFSNLRVIGISERNRTVFHARRN
jgi:hypothetical protein